MPEQLKKCPFCGQKVHHGHGIRAYLDRGPRDFWCNNPNCQISGLCFTEEAWQNRPLEDALQKRVLELEEMDISEHPHYRIPDQEDCHDTGCKCGSCPTGL